jgi:hypothetical protein
VRNMLIASDVLRDKRLNNYMDVFGTQTFFGNKMTPEGKVKAAIDEQIKFAGAYKHKPVQNGMGEPALDYHGSHRGYYFGVEAKKDGGAPTIRQLRTMKKIIAAGGAVFLIVGTNGPDFAQFVGWLLKPIAGFVSASAAACLATLKAKDEYDGEPRDD